MSFKEALRGMDAACKEIFGDASTLDGVDCTPIIDEGVEIEGGDGVIAIVDAAAFDINEISSVSRGQVLVTPERSYRINRFIDKSGNLRRYEIV